MVSINLQKYKNRQTKLCAIFQYKKFSLSTEKRNLKILKIDFKSKNAGPKSPAKNKYFPVKNI